MKVVWVLVILRAISVDEFVPSNIGTYDTIAECHLAATTLFWDDLPDNHEAVCIRVEYADHK